ncbi:hypothetical protein PVK06_031339 [Gossypium arboreum]|uniref:Uncharacterized protein n=1 Tax=Gossypium arboreum TaxID=29729 RepID=A0ABR0NQR3_GOSAR|nr:hypothetical protein PVK06_031339 [Gossypium arboreum]
MVQTHLASGSPYLELYVQFSSPNETFATSTSTVIRDKYTTPSQHSVSGRQNTKAPVFGGSMENTTPARHSISGRNMHISGSMFDAEIRIGERHQLLVVGNPYMIGDVTKRPQEGMMYSLRHPSPRGPHTLQMMVGSTLDSGDLEVGKEFSSVSQDYPNMDSGMIASLTLPILKVDPRISISCIIVSIRSQMRYMPSYHKPWIAKKKELEKMRSGWDASYNEVWQWCQMLERYVPGYTTDLEMVSAYYNERLLRGCQVFKHLFWSFKQCRDTFVYCKPSVQIDGTFMYSRYTHRLLLAVTQNGSGRILLIAFAITPGESTDD